MNTSFNLSGEAIVSLRRPMRSDFFPSGMDALVIGNFLVKSERGGSGISPGPNKNRAFSSFRISMRKTSLCAKLNLRGGSFHVLKYSC